METSIWDQILPRVETRLTRHSFSTWFKPTAFVADGGRSITVRVPNTLFKDWLTKHYSVVLSEALAEVRRSETSLVFVAEPGVALPPPEERIPAAEDVTQVAANGQAPAGLNPRYTFDTFIVGPSNQFAHAACRAVAEAPSRSYNPLFIYGGVGLGKTHLMHAVGQYVLQHDRNLKLTYISSERFMNEMINAVRYDRILDFRELEGSLIRLIAYASLTGREISLELTQEVLKNILDQDDKAVTIETIQKFVSDYYQLKFGELKSKNNSKSIALPRQIAMYICKTLTHASLPEIGRSFGGKHHSTVIHSIKKVDELRKTDGDFNSLITNFLESFK